MSIENKLRKTAYVPYLDVSKTINTDSWQPDWTRINKSTALPINPNPQTETQDFISYETPMTEIDHYEPSIALDQACYKGDPVYDFLVDLFYSLPVGNEAVVPCLLRIGEDKYAWQVRHCVIVFGELNPVDGKLNFTMNLGGDIEKGSITRTGNKPTFVEAA